MAKPWLLIGTVKATGERFLYEARLAWGRRYYRCDMSDAGRWHRSLTDAHRAAAETGTLRRVQPTNQQSHSTQPNQGGIDMSKKTTKRNEKPSTEPELKSKPEPGAKPEATPRRQWKAKQAKGAAKEPKANKPRRERDTVLDLPPADELAPVRAGTHLANVLELTARPEGATAVELDAAIVTTAKSVKHYGLWALRYPLHKNKGYGFTTVQKAGEPARYKLVLPKGTELASLLTPVGGRKASEPAAPVPATKPSRKGAAGKRDAKAPARA